MGSDAMDSWAIAKSLLPVTLASNLDRYSTAEEIRLRLGKHPAVVIGGREVKVSGETVDQSLLRRILEKATGASLHTAAPGLRNGYISYRGIRIGICGEAVYTNGEMSALRAFSSLAIRIPHRFSADCGKLIESLIYPQPLNTLIISPPGVGKTSFLRELIRCAASASLRVSVIDERNELSANLSGEAQFDLGHESDVLVGVPKPQAGMMLLRGMNPQIIAMDEITQKMDIQTVEEIAGCGVTVFATAHARSIEDMKKRTLYRELLEKEIFAELVTIRCLGEKRLYSREALK